MDFSDLLDLFAKQAWDVEKRQLGLVYDPSVSAALGPALLPQTARIREGICEDFEAHLGCFTTNVALPVQAFVGVALALSMRTDQGARRLLPMIVTRATRGRSDGGVMAVHLVGRDPMSIMDARRRFRVFNEMSALDVVCAVLDDWIANTSLGPSLDYSMPGLNIDGFKKRANVVQHPDESDAAFVKRLLRSEGIAWFWRPKAAFDATDGSLPRLELVMFTDAGMLRPNAAATVRYHRRDGTELADTIDLLSEVWDLMPSDTTLATWDHKAARIDARTGLADLDYGRPGRALAHALDQVRVAAPHIGNDRVDLARLAQLRADHATFRSHCLRGRGGVRTLSPGTWQVVEGYAPFDALKKDAAKLVTVMVESYAENNLPAEFHAPARALVGDDGVPDWARPENDPEDPRRPNGAGSSHRFTNRFCCVPITAPIVPTCPDEADEPRRRRLTGIVVADRGDGEVSCDGLNRVSVRLVGAEPGADTVTCQRHVVPWGGLDHGYLATLRDGTEVDLEWTGPDRLVIVGVHYNGKTPPPCFDHLVGLPANAALSGIISRELDGASQQQLRFNDSRGNISTQLGTDHAASQLNLGSLSTPMFEGRTEPRGEGAELRTDAALSLRGGRGVLVSSSARPQGAGQQLDREELAGLATALQGVVEHLGGLADTHRGTGADPEKFRQLVQYLRDWDKGSNTLRDEPDGGAPIVAVSAAAGAGVVSQDNLVLGAQTQVDLVAAGHVQVTAGQQIRQQASAGVSVFSHTGGIQQIAGAGAVEIQAHQGDVQVTASGDLVLTAGRRLFIQAPEVHVISQGAQTQWGGGGIVEQASGTFTVKSGSFTQSGGGDGTPAGVNLPSSNATFDQQVLLCWIGTNEPMAHHRYRITTESGQTIEGRTDARGLTQRFRSRLAFGQYRIEPLGD